MEKRFNIRVYGICIQANQVLINEEMIRGKKIIKFPGGGLEWGEGTIDCLKREWKEELGIAVTVTDHFYTTDFFQPSAFDSTQVISIYYLVEADLPLHIYNNLENERSFLLDIKDISEATFTLPIDKIVGGILQKKYNR